MVLTGRWGCYATGNHIEVNLFSTRYFHGNWSSVIEPKCQDDYWRVDRLEDLMEL